MMKSPWRYIYSLTTIAIGFIVLFSLVLWSVKPDSKCHSSDCHQEPPERDTRGSLPVVGLESHEVVAHSETSYSFGFSDKHVTEKLFHERDSSQHLNDYIRRQDESSFDFSSCRMSNCFNFSRCQAAGPLKVGIVPSLIGDSQESTNRTTGESNLIHARILDIIRKSIHHEPDLDRACILVLEDDTLDRDPLSQSFRPELTNIFNKGNQYGMNYLVFNLYSGTWPDYREDDFAGLRIEAAMLAKASNSVHHHRQGFDISLPLFSYLHPNVDADLVDGQLDIPESQDRSFFLTFKGKRYVFGSGSETRNSVYHIDNRRDIIMLTTCRHGKKWRESSDSRCPEDDSRYNEFDFVELMRESKFCLTPRGRRLGSFRHLEALSYGCIPVILSDGWVKPFDEIIDWSRAALQFNESALLIVGELLRDFSESEIDEMRANGLSIYKQYLATKERIVLTTLSIIEKRVKSELDKKREHLDYHPKDS